MKKFVFHNGGNVLPKLFGEKTHELAYDVIKAYQAHAEGQFIQFLLGSKCHCAECDVLFTLLLGEG